MLTAWRNYEGHSYCLTLVMISCV